MSARATLIAALLGIGTSVSAQAACQPLFDAFRFCATFPLALYAGPGPGVEIFTFEKGNLAFYRVDNPNRPLAKIATDHAVRLLDPDDNIDLEIVHEGGDRVTLMYRVFPDMVEPRAAHPDIGLVSALRYGDRALIIDTLKPNRDLSDGTIKSTPEGAVLTKDFLAKHRTLISKVEPLS